MYRLEKIKNAFLRFPAFVTLAASLILGAAAGLCYVFYVFLFRGVVDAGNALSYLTLVPIFALMFSFFACPLLLTVLNLMFLVVPFKDEQLLRAEKRIEVMTAILGISLSWFYIYISNIKFVEWSESILAEQYHSPVSLPRLPILLAAVALAVVAYMLLRVKNPANWPPIPAALAIGAVYIGIVICIAWSIQIWAHEPILALFPINCVLLALRLIRDLARSDGPAKDWPWMGIIGALPVLGLIAAIGYLRGGSPDDIVKVWTETADWTFSQQIAPPPLPHNGHYLCTVAAQGHEKLVKPLRPGLRHGRIITVNRQLCVANAFEQLLEERTPRLHQAVRSFYDRRGFPLSQLIDKKWKADVVYILMKPAEWFFLFWLYMLDPQPERRISVQYPLTKI